MYITPVLIRVILYIENHNHFLKGSVWSWPTMELEGYNATVIFLIIPIVCYTFILFLFLPFFYFFVVKKYILYCYDNKYIAITIQHVAL